MDWRIGARYAPTIVSVLQDPTILYLSVVVCIAGGLCIWQAASRKKKGPPGPRLSLPIIGHLHLLGKHPHKSLFKLSKVHGPLMWLRFGSVPVIVASSPESARLILQTHDHVFTGRPRPVAAVCLAYGCTDITFSPPNSYWKLMKQICVTDLVSGKCLKAFKPVRESEVRRLVCSIMKEIMAEVHPTSGGVELTADAGTFESVMPKHTASAHETSASNEGTDMPGMNGHPAPTAIVSVRTKLLQANNNIFISRMVFGRTLSEIISSRLHDDPSLNLLELLDELLQCLSVFNLGDLIPSIAWMDLQGVRRHSCAVARKLDIVLQEIFDSRRRSKPSSSTSSPFHKEDLLDIMLSLCSKNPQISDDNIKAFILVKLIETWAGRRAMSIGISSSLGF